MSYVARETAPGPKKMLSIDGGGLRGILSLQVLRRIESLLRIGEVAAGDVSLAHFAGFLSDPTA